MGHLPEWTDKDLIIPSTCSSVSLPTRLILQNPSQNWNFFFQGYVFNLWSAVTLHLRVYFPLRSPVFEEEKKKFSHFCKILIKFHKPVYRTIRSFYMN